ncbi:1-acyl-sn-glycerol-3-phosphate acyltransferase [Sulfurovum mangrovi]|uniref:1-acyl-sn-glycerol-3-phosphate acyltransferase n=1 Tax=Sulfurovum mangrovi TaxID=2893889 RepID=UPI001E4E8A64|nr:1-acyl-sn-glycerol-3-phosphate acyltransferase [Sulfurovum mangrovi]UFH58471.1 1-acyl-sn-glycerol-3-phosphate acyltransferase [Sulfurovum mangrovi]
MKSQEKIDLSRIEQTIMKISKFVKEVAVFIHKGQLFAAIYPDLEEAKRRNLIRIENEIRWYAVELYNIKAESGRKIKGYQIVRSPLPKKNNGEINRSELESFLREQRSQERESEKEPEDEVYQTIKRFLSTLTAEPILPSSHLELDLHLDSLNYIELFSFIDKSFGVTVDEARFSQMMVMLELSRYVREKKEKLRFASISWRTILDEKIDFDLHTSPLPILVYKTLFLPLYRLYFSLKISGVEKIPERPCIIAPSHQSMLDGFILAAALPYSVLKRTFFLAFEMVFGTKIMRPIIRNSQTVLINVNKDLKASVQKSAVPLRQGQNLVVFPEGARSRDRELLEFKKFFAILAIELDIPVVPTVLDGTFESLPAGRLFPRPSPVVVKYLDPIYPEGLSYEALTEKVKGAIEKEMKRDPLQR